MTKKQPVDLAKIDLAADGEKGAEFELVHPITNEPLDIYITVLSKESNTFKRLIREKINRNIREASILKPSSGRNANITTVEKQRADSIENMVACTINWRNVVHDGKELVFSETAATMLYTVYDWIFEQVDRAIGDLSLFTKS